MDVTDYVAASCHVSFARLALGDIDDRIEEVGLAMLASKVLFQCASQLMPPSMGWSDAQDPGRLPD
jgi:hypothetical protein